MATEDTTIADVELEASVKLIARWIKNQLLLGKRTKIAGLRTLRSDLLRNLTFENAGVEDEGVYYGSLDNNKEIKGLRKPSGAVQARKKLVQRRPVKLRGRQQKTGRYKLLTPTHKTYCLIFKILSL